MDDGVTETKAGSHYLWKYMSYEIQNRIKAFSFYRIYLLNCASYNEASPSSYVHITSCVTFF